MILQIRHRHKYSALPAMAKPWALAGNMYHQIVSVIFLKLYVRLFIVYSNKQYVHTPTSVAIPYYARRPFDSEPLAHDNQSALRRYYTL
jgi:hypothetical protein